MFVLLFVVLGMILVGLSRFATEVIRTEGGWRGALATLPLLVVLGLLAYLVAISV